jgi:hypothetical protein
LAAGLVVAGAYWVYRQVFPPDRVVIRKSLRELAQGLSYRNEGGRPLAVLAGLNRVLGHFTADVEIRLDDVPGVRDRVIEGRSELRELIAGSRAGSDSIRIRLLEVFVERIDQGEAMAQIIVGARVDGQEDEFIQELRLELVKEGRKWLIRRVDPVPTLKMKLAAGWLFLACGLPGRCALSGRDRIRRFTAQVPRFTRLRQRLGPVANSRVWPGFAPGRGAGLRAELLGFSGGG